MVTGIFTSIANCVRILLIAAFVFVNWPGISALASGDIGWNDAVSSLFTNWGILVVSVVIILTLVISFLQSRIISLIVDGIAILIIVGLAAGTISVGSLKETVSAHIDVSNLSSAIQACGLKTVIEKNGDDIRTMLKNEKGDTVGYVLEDDGYDDMRKRLVDESGKVLSCP